MRFSLIYVSIQHISLRVCVQYCQLPHFSASLQKKTSRFILIAFFLSVLLRLKSVLCYMQLFPSFSSLLALFVFHSFSVYFFSQKKTQVVYIIAARHRESSVFISRSNMEKRILHTQKKSCFFLFQRSALEVAPFRKRYAITQNLHIYNPCWKLSVQQYCAVRAFYLRTISLLYKLSNLWRSNTILPKCCMRSAKPFYCRA